MWIIIIGVIILAGLFNPYTGLFDNTYYSPKKEKEEEPELLHRSFKLTRGD